MLKKTTPLSDHMSQYTPTTYPPAEERFNVISHGIGFVLSLVATVLLWSKASAYDNGVYTISFLVYGCSMMLLYAGSTCYHNSKDPTWRARLNILDHSAIYLLIAGTYTPFTLITLPSETGTWVFTAVWIFALVGVVLKLFFTGRYDKLSTAMYLFMGWMIVFAARPLIANLATDGLYWLIAGGLCYTIGAVLYSLDGKLRYNHAIWHVFVLGGSACHFMAVYQYVLPPLV